MHESILIYKRFMYLKLALIVVLVSIVLYAAHDPVGPANGGTWLGYGLGTLGALLILWLMWFGVRKRRYTKRKRLEDWLSAHIYLGLALIFVATLHTGFQFGWNVHTLAYTLMMLVILSGVFGLYAYIRYPAEMTANRRGLTQTDMMLQIAELDAEMREAAMGLGDEVNDVLLKASQGTRIGGGFWRQLSGHDSKCPTHAALVKVEQLAEQDAAGAGNMRRLLSLLTRKDELLQRARRDVQLKGLMDAWLYIHVPLTFGLIAALIAHVISVFFYW
jgi:hypothetical protein